MIEKGKSIDILLNVVKSYYDKRMLERITTVGYFERQIANYPKTKITMFKRLKWFCEDNICWRFKLHKPEYDYDD